MPIAGDVNFEENLSLSIEAFLYANIVVPYNTAVAGSAYDSPLSIIMEKPDDAATIAETPVLAMAQPIDYTPAVPLGMADREVWQYKLISICCYPALSNENNVLKPSIKATGYLRSLVNNISTALTIPLSDYSTNPPTVMDGAYIVSGRILTLRGAISMLAIDKHRFDYELKIRFPMLTLNG